MTREEKPASSKAETCEDQPPGDPNPVDIHIGARLRLRRTGLGLSRQALGDAARLTPQQIEKYECAANHVSGSKLFEFSRILGVPVIYFFNDMPGALKTPEGWLDDILAGKQDNDEESTHDEICELITAYYKITDPLTRKSLFKLLRTLA